VVTEPVIRLEGEYDLTRKDEVAAMFTSIGDIGPIVIDMTDVSYIDSMILLELATLKSRNDGRAIKIIGLNSHIRRVFSIVKFDELFELTDA
jgi:anti-anti-sigma factor